VSEYWIRRERNRNMGFLHMLNSSSAQKNQTQLVVCADLQYILMCKCAFIAVLRTAYMV
jgi:hypothetical protein